MKSFVKLQCDIVDRFDDDSVLLLFVKLLCLMDREGRIRMDYDAIAARIRWPLDRVVPRMESLMQPDPQSRCQKYGGACVVLLDPKRPKAGFLIPAAVSHRKSNADTERRRLSKNKWLRENRKSRAKNPIARKPTRGSHGEVRGSHGEVRGSLPLPGKEVRGSHGEVTRKSKEDCEREYREESTNLNGKVCEGTTLPAHKPSNSKPDEIHNVDQAISLICEKVFDGRLRKNQIGQETLRLLTQLLPMSREQIELVADYYTLPADDCWPELKKRGLVTIDRLIRYWPDHVALAVMFDQKYFAR